MKIARSQRPALAAVEEGRTRFIPGKLDEDHYEWMRNIKTGVSAARSGGGHRIPAWYDPQGNVYVGRSEAEDPQETSNVGQPEAGNRRSPTRGSPQRVAVLTLGWPEKTSEMAKFYPTSGLITGLTSSSSGSPA